MLGTVHSIENCAEKSKLLKSWGRKTVGDVYWIDEIENINIVLSCESPMICCDPVSNFIDLMHSSFLLNRIWLLKNINRIWSSPDQCCIIRQWLFQYVVITWFKNLCNLKLLNNVTYPLSMTQTLINANLIY